MTGLEKLWQDISGALLRENRWQLYLEGLRNTLVIAALACLIGIVIGLVVALIKYIASTKKSGPWKVAGAICTAYTTVIRGTPIIVQLLILYNLSYFTDGLYASIIGFGINSGAYVAEIFRSGLNSIDIGQREAGRSLGLGQWPTMRLIVLPQAIKNTLPALFNEFIALLKETSVAGYIAVRDLTKVADGIRGRTFNSVPLYLAAALYLIMVAGLAALQKRMEKRLARSDRS
ncbi:MAG: amino acid ABC transporter permease [Clostridiales bacterium]|jgi:His/Glu/Gln/Arg/opine family amino acid ABC transporter permease subunit|nr:amino acid ABC transporter permease [Clostridiales bacterium]